MFFSNLFNDLKDDLQDIGEFYTVGFNETVIKNNTNYQTSVERKRTIEEKLSDISLEYQEICLKLKKKISKYNCLVTTVNELRVKIINAINTYDLLPNINITSKYELPHAEHTLKYSELVGPFMLIPIASYKKNMQYIHQAEISYQNTRLQIGKLKHLKGIIKAASYSLKRELKIYHTIENTLYTYQDMQFEEIMKRITTLLSLELITAENEINELYEKALNELSLYIHL